MNGDPVVGTIATIIVGTIIFYLLYCGMIFDFDNDKKHSSYLEVLISPITEFRKDRIPPCYKCKYCKGIGFCSRKSAIADKESKLNTYLPYGVKCDEIRGTRFCKFKECSKDELEEKKSVFLERKPSEDYILQTVGGNGYRKLVKSIPLHEDIPISHNNSDLWLRTFGANDCRKMHEFINQTESLPCKD